MFQTVTLHDMNHIVIVNAVCNVINGEVMPRKKPSILSIEEQKTLVDVVVRDSNLPSSDGKAHKYGSIVHRKVTVRSILAEMENNYQTFVSKETMFYIAEELSRRMMDKFKHGYSVELLDFGTIFPTIKGSISQTDTPSKIKKQFDVGFTPSDEARAALQNLTVRNVRRPSLQHCIFSVINMFEPEEKNRLKVGCMAKINGKAIKLGGEKSGIYAASVGENWNGKLPGRENWIEMKHVTQNKPSSLDFYVEGIEPGLYVFIVETSLSVGGKELKNSVIVHSTVVQVEDK